MDRGCCINGENADILMLRELEQALYPLPDFHKDGLVPVPPRVNQNEG